MPRIIKDGLGVEHTIATYEDAIEEGHQEWCAFASEYGMFCNCGLVPTPEAVEHRVQLTALRRWLAVSIFINVILLAVVLYAIGGN